VREKTIANIRFDESSLANQSNYLITVGIMGLPTVLKIGELFGVSFQSTSCLLLVRSVFSRTEICFLNLKPSNKRLSIAVFPLCAVENNKFDFF